MVNRKENRKLVCRGCGKQRVIADQENKLCGECAALFVEGALTPDMLKPERAGGRPPVRVEEPEDDVTEEPYQDEPTSAEYACDVCNAAVKRGQRICRCGAWLDWRDTDVEEDAELVVCPRCGAICGYVDACTRCPHCGYDGD